LPKTCALENAPSTSITIWSVRIAGSRTPI
jgi:hypothetical protein